jgi:hypothetical protein
VSTWSFRPYLLVHEIPASCATREKYGMSLLNVTHSTCFCDLERAMQEFTVGGESALCLPASAAAVVNPKAGFGLQGYTN